MEQISNIQENEIVKHERNYKDKLFRKIYGTEDPRSARWRLELYNALSGKNHTDPDELEITTLDNVLYLNMKNDVSFLVDSQMSLWEHQSTLNPNMPLRGLFYFSLLYQNYLMSKDEALFTTQLKKIPSPKYYVFYIGNEETDDISKLRLSDAFLNDDKTGDFEWTATVININKNHNEMLHKKCKSLYDYCIFIDRIKTNIKNNMNKEVAIDEAIDWAVKENLLEGLIKEQRAEVRMDLLTDFDQEQYDRILRREGKQEKAVEDALFIINKYKATPESAAKDMNAPLELVLEALKQNNKTN